ncbi:MAG: hypothetical protein ACRECO_18885 [Xanthobacteraceae bacterium]
MSNIRTKMVYAVVAVAASLAVAAPASAKCKTPGFGAKILHKLGAPCKVVRKLDRIHHHTGKPLDRVGKRILRRAIPILR